MLAHLLTFVGYRVVLGSFVPPLVIWQVNKTESSFVVEHAKEALNFQITVLLAALLGVVMLLSVVLACVAIPYFAVLGVAEIVFVDIAAIKAGQGEAYEYPGNLRLVK